MPESGKVIGSPKDVPRSKLIGVFQQRIPKRQERWTKRELQPRLESATVEGVSTKERRVIEYRKLIARLVHFNHTISSENLPAQWLVAEEDDEEWLLADMSDRWIRRLDTRAGQELQMQKAEDAREQHLRILNDRLMSDAEWQRERAAYHKIERVANKNMWEECKSMVLRDWKNASGFDCTGEVQQLLNLQVFHDIQKAELHARTDTAHSLVSKTISGTESLVDMAGSRLNVLENQTETADCLLQLSEESMLRVHKRVRRLVAKDVEGETARREEMRRRLQHSKALDYMFEAKGELEAARAVVNSTKRFLESIEEDLEEVIMATVDTISALKGARLALDFEKGRLDREYD